MISIKSTILNSEEKLQKDVNKFKKFNFINVDIADFHQKVNKSLYFNLSFIHLFIFYLNISEQLCIHQSNQSLKKKSFHIH